MQPPSSSVTGLDDPGQHWMQSQVRVKEHPEWGVACVVRWYPSSGSQPERLRVMARNLRAARLVTVDQVERVDIDAAADGPSWQVGAG